ncbi:MAG TPA: hypothetical protein PKA37_18875, partial [Planctomycetota bacterium]|nr:hypothetical protein [Planctomycetota bacterium]
GYHSGELPNNNPWAAATASNGVTWTVDQTFASNPNSNALRWGTAYSFWFDASSAAPLGASLDFYRVAGSAMFHAHAFPPEAWQVNQANAHMDIDGLSNSSFSGPIVANKNSGSIGALNFGARAGGIPYDIALTLAPAVPNFIVTGGGQRINVDLFHPTFTWLFNAFASVTPGAAWNLSFVAPNGTLDLTGQMAILDGASPEGILITAANELHVTPCIAGSQSLTLGDDTFGTIALGAGNFACVPALTFAGTSYTTAYVNSNGSVSFVQGSTDYTATTGEFNSQMPRLAGMWTDLNPSAGGTVTAASTIGGLFTVTFAGVPQFGNTSAPNSFVLE